MAPAGAGSGKPITSLDVGAGHAADASDRSTPRAGARRGTATDDAAAAFGRAACRALIAGPVGTLLFCGLMLKRMPVEERALRQA